MCLASNGDGDCDMPRYEVTYVDRLRPIDRDAVVLALRVTRDGEYFQFVEAIVSGIDLALRRRSSISVDRFWGWFARAAVELIEKEIRAGTLRLTEPTTAAFVAPDVGAVVRRAEAETIEALRQDAVIAAFDL